MTSLYLVDAELRPLLDFLPRRLLTRANLAEARAEQFPMPDVGDTAATAERVVVPGAAGDPDVSLHIYRPQDARPHRPCIYHMHGGGFVMGSAAALEPIHRLMAAKLGCVIVSVDYRLAPETTFPGAIEDCYAGLAWTFANAGLLGVDRGCIGLMGESAGGGLAAALALLARDRRAHLPAFQHLIYPMLDDRTCNLVNPHPYAGEYVWPAHNNRFGWASLLGRDPGEAGVSSYAAPARADDLRGLPRAFIASGALDLFVEEDLEYGRRLIRAGVPVEMHVYEGAFHAFDLMPGAAVARAFRRDSVDALRRAFSLSKSPAPPVDADTARS